jgi:hypothetical protein
MRLVFLLLSLTIFSCNKETPKVTREPLCGNTEKCMPYFTLEVKAKLKAPLPTKHIVLLNGEKIFDSCLGHLYDPDVIKTRWDGFNLNIEYRKFKGMEKIDLEIINQGNSCAAYITRIIQDDFPLTTSTRSGQTHFHMSVQE